MCKEACKGICKSKREECKTKREEKNLRNFEILENDDLHESQDLKEDAIDLDNNELHHN